MLNLSIFDYFAICFKVPSTKYHSIAFTLVNVPFVLPLCLYILYLGVQQWRSRAKISHTDFFTYNIVMVLLLGVLGFCILTVNLIFHRTLVIIIGIFMLSVTYFAVLIFQIFMCLERYLAAVHPVTYLGLKSQSWILIRNISCGFVWLQCIIHSSYFGKGDNMSGLFYFTLLGVSFGFLFALFCNLRVFCVLIRPRPGDVAKGNKLKQRALYTITAIAGTLLFRFLGEMLALFIFTFFTSRDNAHLYKSCAVFFSVNWFSLLSSLVLPMQFLQRKGKLPCFQNKQVMF